MNKKATMLYLMKDDDILFLIRDKKNDRTHKQGMHLSIGGKIELGETAVEAAVREAKEESGLNVTDLQLKGILHFIGWGEDKEDWVNFLFVSEKFSGKPKAGNEGRFEWIPKKNIQSMSTLYEGDKIFLPELIRNNFVVIEFIYDCYQLKEHRIITKL